MDYVKTRKEAMALGALHYFTGEPCSRGHIALRKTKGCCVECMKEDWASDNERRKSKPKSEAAKASGRRYYERNKEAVIARAQARPNESKYRYKSKYKQDNPDLYKELVNARRRRYKLATPKWLTEGHKVEIRVKYRLAIELSRTLGKPHAVDHIVPINGEVVCGLHVPWNLRVITQEENLKKSNNFES